nr:hypothetical protein [Erythrotrichia foliiformis]
MNIEHYIELCTFNKVENFAIYKNKSNYSGSSIVYWCNLFAICNDSITIILEVNSVNYRAISLYFYHGFQLYNKRLKYYKVNRENCFLMANINISSKSSIYRLALLSIRKQFIYNF